MVNNIPVNGWPQLKDLEAVQPILNRLDKIEAWKRTVKEETFTGDDITIENALALPARSLITEINAIQDLHGYDHPWVGGAYKNKLDSSAVTQGSFNDSSATANCVSDYTPISGGADYYMSGNSGYADGIYLRFYDANKTELDTSTRISKYVVAFGFTAPSTAVYTRIMWYKGGGLTPTNVVNALVQLEIGSTATSFAPYSNICPISGRDSVVLTRSDGDEISEDFTIQLGTTVYGAEINWDTGVMTVTDILETFDGSNDENWTRYNSGSASAYAMTIPTMLHHKFVQANNIITNYLKALSTTETWGDYDTFITSNGNTNIITGIRDITTVEAWKTYLAGNPLQVCYELATPTTIQLTPTQLEMLKGYNRITLTDGYGTIELKALTGANWS